MATLVKANIRRSNEAIKKGNGSVRCKVYPREANIAVLNLSSVLC